MKQFSVFFAVAFIVLIGSSHSLGASVGARDNSNPQQPASPQGVTVDIALDASLIATTLGISGLALASQQVEEQVLGDVHTPAQVTSSSGVQTELVQQGGIEEVAVADLVAGTSATLNQVQAGHTLVAEADLFDVELLGGLGAEMASSVESYGFGGGVILVDGNTAVLEGKKIRN